MKKLLAIFLSLLMLCALCVTASAEDKKGSITINGVGENTTYEIYRILELKTYDVDAGAYSYKAADEKWTAFLATDAAKEYLTTDADGYVTWTGKEDDDSKATFAKLALKYAQDNGITPVKSSNNADEFVVNEATGKFSDLPLGYYLVDSTMGALCGLTTTNPDASINAKNAIPTIDKQVQEDSTTQWGAHNTADIGQIIDYRVTINVHAGAENYVLHDTMEDGLTFKEITGIQHVIPGTETHAMDTKDYSVKLKSDDPSLITDDCTFEIHFTKEICDKLETNDKIIVSYTAMLNRNAVVAEDGNINTAWLTFGTGSGKSNVDSVTTYTYGIDIIKTDSSNKLIDGAEFKIYDAAEGGNEIKVVPTDDAAGYRRARTDETGVAIVVKGGKIRVDGLDNGTYYLEETKEPDGYNRLTARQRFIISDANLDATFNKDIYSTGSGVHVVNKTGSMMPETGGMGTVLFTLFGGLVVVATGVVLVTKKRLSKIKE